MGSTDRDGLLLHLDKMLKACKEKGSVTISLKRCKSLFFNFNEPLSHKARKW